MTQVLEKELLEEDEVYRLTVYGILTCIAKDYNIDISHITPKMADHLYEDFMELLCRQGYVTKDSDENGD